MIGVYVIRCNANNKFYIGVSKDIESRWREHRSDLKNNKHHCIRLQRCYNKYGKNSFEYLTVYNSDSYEQAINLEVAMITALDGDFLLNSSKTSRGFGVGYKHTDEIKKKISLALIGNKYTVGYRHTAEAKEKQRLSSLTNIRCIATRFQTSTIYIKDGVKYNGSKEASVKTNIPRTTLMRYAKANKQGWSVINTDRSE